MMERGLDHLVYATPDLDASVEALAEHLRSRYPVGRTQAGVPETH